MRRSDTWLWVTGAVALIAVITAAAVVVALRTRGSTPQSAAAPPASTHSGHVAASSEQPSLPRLSTRQLAGQRVIYSYSGLTPPASLLRLIRDGDAAGVIFFKPNISSTTQIARVIRELERANEHSPVRDPLLLMTDQEGGLVRRLPGAPALSEREIGESPDPSAEAREAGTGAGLTLLSVGMNVDLAPVLDVYREPGDFIDATQRSYSDSPALVSDLGADFIRSLQATGAAATAKHFPGLGAATADQDTDTGPVTLDLPAQTIRDVDEKPYRAAIAAGVNLVMLSWATYPSLDPGRPAGLSRAIVQGQLRDRLGFRGVTITDALEAGALKAFGSIPHRGVLAAQAGMDLLLCSAQNVGEGTAVMNGLVKAMDDGQLSRSTFRASVARVLALRSTLPG